jgi:hypothetical protein
VLFAGVTTAVTAVAIVVRTVDEKVAEAAMAMVVAMAAAVVVERVADERVVVVMVVAARLATTVLLAQPAGDPASGSRLLLRLTLTFIGRTPVWHIHH